MRPVGAALIRPLAAAAGIFVLAALSLLYVLARLEITVDLAYFLPQPQTLAEEVLTDRLGQGPGSRILVVTVQLDSEGADSGDIDAIVRELRRSQLLSAVNDGSFELDRRSIPEALWKNRYLLRDAPVAAADLERALQNRLGDMAMLADRDFLELVAADPSLESLALLEQLVGTGARADSAWLDSETAAGRHYLLVETTAPSFDAEAQSEAVALIDETVRAYTGSLPELHGAGAYSAELQTVVRTDAGWRSAAATVFIIIVLLLMYRNAAAVPFSLIPVLLAGIAGCLALTLVYGRIHGITLAFGFTLLGVAIDYPLHLLSHARAVDPVAAVRSIWPTLRLGALTTAMAYIALAFGGSRGLAQLGLFSAVGVLVAAATVRWFMPSLMALFTAPKPVVAAQPSMPGLQLRHRYWLVLLSAALMVLLWQRPMLWQSDLSELVPVSQERLLRDGELRKKLGVPEIGYLLAVKGASYEDVLVRTEQLEPRLEKAIDAGVLAGVSLATALLPSKQRQQERLQRYAGVGDLEARVRSAVSGSPFRPDAFAAFVADMEQLRGNSALVSPATWLGSSFAELVDFSVYSDDAGWVSQSLLFGLAAPESLEQLLADLPGVSLIDLRGASVSLVDSYRQRMLTVLIASLALVIALLWWQIGFGRRLVWVMGSIVSALAVTVALKLIYSGGLSLFALIACVLVAGLGLDYGLFRSRGSATEVSHAATAHAIKACALSTLGAFTLLAMSPIPVLRDIGFIVATGVACTYVLMIAGSRHGVRSAS